MGKIKKIIEAMKSCYSCFYCRNGIEDLKYIQKVFCLKKNRTTRFRKWCLEYEPITCKNCGFCDSGLIVHKGLEPDMDMRYKYHHIWLIKCNKLGLIEEETLSNRRGTLKIVPSCSLWKRKEVSE